MENYSNDESDMDISLPDQDYDSEEDLEDYADLEDNLTTTHELDSDDTDPDKAHKYVVFEQCLFELLDICAVCSRRNLQHMKTTVVMLDAVSQDTAKYGSYTLIHVETAKVVDIQLVQKYKIAGEWARSISNHAYWCAASSGGNAELVRKKLTSILNHVANIHEGHRDLFHMGTSQEGGSSQEMEKIVCGKLLMKDVRELSSAHQTSCLDASHNAPKTSYFFYNQMKARLAAFHFNSGGWDCQIPNCFLERKKRRCCPKGD
ncbi:uncharacterized protein LOC132553328 [Ylistrum balloti]|uniref:uncharacterized protein LOC132553328 n=1 Tax=Ylistrum balloti TaxID=509963 RepID=UPI002905C70A|nr:uncharacterized protein LOC132553328 [Ylistrum balloti]